MNLRNPSVSLAWIFVSFAPLLHAQDLDTGLIAYFPFSGNANDESGNNNDGKAIGPVLASDRYGNRAHAFRFDGQDDRIEVPGNRALNLRQELSLTAWVFALSRKSQVILIKGSSLTGTQAAPYGMSLSGNGDIVFSLRSAQGTAQARASGYPLGRWFAVAGTFSEGSMKLYVDGKSVSSQSAEFAPGANDQPLLIGTRLGLPSSTFDGVIDDIRIYNRSLDAGEIGSLYDLEAAPNRSPVAEPAVAPDNGRGQLSAIDPDRDALTFALNSQVAGLSLSQSGSYTFDNSDPVYTSLAVGETLQIVANWTVTDGRGASDSSTLTINVIGRNDPPIAQSSSATDPQGGQLSATDPDSNATLTFSLEQQVPGLAISEAGSYTFNPSHPAYASIPEGETGQVIATWTVTDDKGASDTGTLTITVTGVNDPPVAEPAVAPDNGRGQLTASDPDRNATLSFTLDSEVFGFYLDENGSYTFDSSHPFYISLPQGETLQTVANWSVTDDKGASDTGTLTITVTGRNDPPVAEPAVAPSSGRGQLTAVDPDRNTTLSFTLGSQVAGLSLSQSGSYTFDNSDPAYTSLAVGETLRVVANWTVTDERGASDSSTLTINVIGRNDPPVAQSSSATDPQGGQLSATDPDSDPLTFSLDQQVPGLAVSESGSYTFNPSHPAYSSIPEDETGQVIANWSVTDDKGASDTGTLTITVTGRNDPPVAQPAVAPSSGTGQLTAVDPDRNTTLSFTLGSQVAGLSLSQSGSYTFDNSDPAYTSLAGGETLRIVANWTVTDERGASDSSTLTITARGNNDPPVAVEATSDGSTTPDLASNGATFKLKWKHERNPISTLSGTLSFPANTITNAPNIDFESVPGSNLIIRSGEQIFNYLEPVIYFTSDSQVDFSKELVGQITDFNIFTSRFLGWGPSILEGRDGLYSLVSMIVCPSGQLEANDPDNGAILTYSLDSPVAGLFLNPDGTYTFDPFDPAYAWIPSGTTLDVVADWTVIDDQGASDSSTLTITVTGTNNALVGLIAQATAPSNGQAASFAPHSPRILNVSASTSPQSLRSVTVTFSSQPGETYSIQRSRDLAQWSNLAEILSEEETTEFTDNDPILDGDPVFYRAKMANP